MVRLHKIEELLPLKDSIVVVKTHWKTLHICKVSDEAEYWRTHSSDKGYPWAKEGKIIFTHVIDSCYEPVELEEVDGWIYEDELAELLTTL